jgi:hypothetical protein
MAVAVEIIMLVLLEEVVEVPDQELVPEEQELKTMYLPVLDSEPMVEMVVQLMQVAGEEVLVVPV